jgi:hypothetical protein
MTKGFVLCVLLCVCEDERRHRRLVYCRRVYIIS